MSLGILLVVAYLGQYFLVELLAVRVFSIFSPIRLTGWTVSIFTFLVFAFVLNLASRNRRHVPLASCEPTNHNAHLENRTHVTLATLGLLVWWMDHPDEVTFDQMVEIVDRLIIAPVRGGGKAAAE